MSNIITMIRDQSNEFNYSCVALRQHITFVYWQNGSNNILLEIVIFHKLKENSIIHGKRFYQFQNNISIYKGKKWKRPDTDFNYSLFLNL